MAGAESAVAHCGQEAVIGAEQRGGHAGQRLAADAVEGRQASRVVQAGEKAENAGEIIRGVQLSAGQGPTHFALVPASGQTRVEIGQLAQLQHRRVRGEVVANPPEQAVLRGRSEDAAVDERAHEIVGLEEQIAGGEVEVCSAPPWKVGDSRPPVSVAVPLMRS